MDWLLDTRQPDAVGAAVHAVQDHLLRHTSDESLLDGAVQTAEQALRVAADEHPALWLRLDWTRMHPTLTLTPTGTGDTEGDGFAAVPPERLGERPTGESGVDVDLTLPREVAASFDPEVGSMAHLDPVADGAACLPVALAAAAELHPVASPDQVAAAAGAMLADAAVAGADVDTPEDVAERLLRLHEALGGSGRAVSVTADRVELLLDRGLFGSAVRQVPSLSRVSEGMAGRIAARARGSVTVVHDESIASGDSACRLQLLFTEPAEDVVGSRYTWPPAGIVEQVDPSPRLEMSVSLPRQSHSVPVIRRLSAQILRAFGAAPDSIHDVELAISEACANVIQHAGPGSEGYEVSIELASDRCAITVLDRGDGFDASGVADQDDDDAESGRGLTLMRALVDNLNFVSEPKVGAVVHMVKSLDYDQNHPFRRADSA